jgi:hypothetical protein
MKAKRPRVPKGKSVIVVSQTLTRLLPMDKPPDLSWHDSKAGRTAFRLASVTKNTAWTVDIYSPKFMCVRIGNHFSEVCNSIPSVVLYFCRMLKIRIGTHEGTPSNND